MAPGPQPPPGTLTSYTSSPTLSPYFTTLLSQLKTQNQTSHPPFKTTDTAHLVPTSTNPLGPKHSYVVASCLVFTSSQPPNLLIVQRSAHDYGGNLWETPGGSCEMSESILDGAVRELWEESGLVATKVVGQVGEPEEWIDRGEMWRKFSFAVEVEEGEVRLDEEEHQDFMWVSEEECKAGFVVRDEKRVEIEWTWKSQFETILEGFRLRKGEKVEA